MRTVSRVHLWILNALMVCSQIVIFGVFVLIVVDVAMTILSGLDIGISPWDRTLGLVEYGLLWFTMLAAPWLARMKGHVFIDAVKVLLSPSIQKVIAKFAYLVAFCGSAVFAYYSVLLFWEAVVEEQIDERGADMFLWALYFPMPIGFALLAIEFLRYLFGFDDMYAKGLDASGAL